MSGECSSLDGKQTSVLVRNDCFGELLRVCAKEMSLKSTDRGHGYASAEPATSDCLCHAVQDVSLETATVGAPGADGFCKLPLPKGETIPAHRYASH